MAVDIIQWMREKLLFEYGYLQGRVFFPPSSFADAYGRLVAKATALVALPLPLLSFLALPLYGGSTATVNLVFFYMTWSALIYSYDPLKIEIYSTIVIRLLCFVLPAMGFLAFDLVLPEVSRRIKARGEKQLPVQCGHRRLAIVTVVALVNIFLAIVLQASLELVSTKILRTRSLIKISSTVPLPWSIIKDLLKGFMLRGIIHYGVHRYLLHKFDSLLRTWHLTWQHEDAIVFSLIAAYDHPVNYLLAVWLPTILPAYLFRYHVLTWCIFTALTSLEELFVYSGYAVLPSSIVLAGMARRIEAHFDSARTSEPGNFGHLGVVDFLMGTTCKEESTVIDDFKDEAEKRRFQQRVEDAVQVALASIEKKKSGDSAEDEDREDSKNGEDKTAEPQTEEPAPPRRSRRGKTSADGAAQ